MGKRSRSGDTPNAALDVDKVSSDGSTEGTEVPLDPSSAPQTETKPSVMEAVKQEYLKFFQKVRCPSKPDVYFWACSNCNEKKSASELEKLYDLALTHRDPKAAVYQLRSYTGMQFHVLTKHLDQLSNAPKPSIHKVQATLTGFVFSDKERKQKIQQLVTLICARNESLSVVDDPAFQAIASDWLKALKSTHNNST